GGVRRGALPGRPVRLLPAGAVHVRSELDTAADPECPEVPGRRRGAVGNDEHRRVAAELERLRHHRLELQLVDELGEADDERRRAGAVSEGPQRPSVLQTHERKLTLARALVLDPADETHFREASVTATGAGTAARAGLSICGCRYARLHGNPFGAPRARDQADAGMERARPR